MFEYVSLIIPIFIGGLILILIATLFPQNSIESTVTSRETDVDTKTALKKTKGVTDIQIHVENSADEKQMIDYYVSMVDPQKFTISSSSSQNPDMALLIGNATSTVNIPKSSVVALFHEPSTSRSISQETLAQVGTCLLSGTDRSHASYQNHYTYGPTLPLHKINGPWQSKSRPMSILLTETKQTENQKYAYDLVELILDLDLDVDVFGKGAEYFQSLESYQHNSHLIGQSDDVENVYRTYQFTIAIESTSEPHYITDKFVNAILCDTVPIYLGAPNVEDYFGAVIPLNRNLSHDIQLVQNILEDPKRYVVPLEAARQALAIGGKANLQTYLQCHVLPTNWNTELAYRNAQYPKPLTKLKPRLLIGGIAKDIASNVTQLKVTIQRLIDTFETVEFYVFENNSMDETARLLQQWQTEDRQHIFVKCLNLTREEQLNLVRARTFDDKPCRIELISWARNQLLDMMRPAERQEEFDFVIMLDTDIANVDMRALIQTIQYFPKDKADVLFANGLDESGASGRGNYYDFFALRMANYPYGQEISKSALDRIPEFELILKMDAPLFPVYSAFGGLAIYKMDTFEQNPKYSPYPNDALTQLYDELLPLYPDHPLISEVQRDENGHAKYIPCCGYYQCSIVCEHVVFHASLRAMGNTKMYIAPELVYIVAGSH